MLMTVYTKFSTNIKSNFSSFLKKKNQRSYTKRVDSSVSSVTGTRQLTCRCLIPSKKSRCLCSKISWPALWSAQPSSQWVTGSLLGVIRARGSYLHPLVSKLKVHEFIPAFVRASSCCGA